MLQGFLEKGVIPDITGVPGEGSYSRCYRGSWRRELYQILQGFLEKGVIPDVTGVPGEGSCTRCYKGSWRREDGDRVEGIE